jgi:hypothetical protein
MDTCTGLSEESMVSPKIAFKYLKRSIGNCSHHNHVTGDITQLCDLQNLWFLKSTESKKLKKSMEAEY